MATGMYSWSQTAASNSTADTAINWAEGQLPSTVNDSARGMMSVLAKWRDDISGVQPSNVVQTSGGAANVQTLTTNASIAALTNGWTVAFKAGFSNTAACTLNVDSLGAKSIQRISGTALVGGELVAGCVYTVTYHQPADSWVLHSSGTSIGQDNIVFATGKALQTGTGAGNTLLLQAYDVDGAAYTTFATLTANNTPTMDLNTATTIGTAAIYRVGGTDVAVADGGTGLSSGTSGGVLYYSAAATLASSGALTANAIVKGGGAGAAPTASGVSIDASNNVSTAGSVKSTGTGGVGYATGAGGAVTQITNKSTGVTLNTICGQITLAAENMASNASANFVVTNSAVAATDVILFSMKSDFSYYTVDVYNITAGSFTAIIRNLSASSHNDQPVLNFIVLKAVAA